METSWEVAEQNCAKKLATVAGLTYGHSMFADDDEGLVGKMNACAFAIGVDEGPENDQGYGGKATSWKAWAQLVGMFDRRTKAIQVANKIMLAAPWDINHEQIEKVASLQIHPHPSVKRVYIQAANNKLSPAWELKIKLLICYSV
jgi:hypothetical protein